MKRRLALRVLVPAGLLALGAVVIVVASLSDLGNSLNRSEANSERRLQELMGFAASDLESAHRTESLQASSQTLRTLTRYRDVSSALVVGPDGHTAYATDLAELGKPLQSSQFAAFRDVVDKVQASRKSDIVRDGNHLIGVAPVAWILREGELLPSRHGVLLVRYDMSSQIDAEIRDVIRTAMSLTVAILVFSGLAALAFSRILGRDIDHLVQKAQAITRRQPEPAGSTRLREAFEVETALAETRQIIKDQIRSLETSEARFRDIVETSREWIFEADEHWRFTYSNDAIVKLLGYLPDDLRKRKLPELLSDSKASRARFEQLATVDEFSDVELELVDLNGQPREIRLSGYRRRVPQVQIRIVAIDITQAKQTEKLLLQSQKLEAVGQLAGGIAHDFNNILSVILSRCELLLADAATSPGHAAELAEVRDNVMTASQLTKRLMALSRRDFSAPRVLDVNAEIRRAARLLESAAGEPVQIEQQLDDSLPKVLIDPGKLEQILLNLTLNSRHAMPGGGTISIRTCTERGQLGGREHVSIAALYFSDTGCGIEQSIIDRIFEPFFSTRRNDGGSGLGLASVMAAVESAGGSVTVTSQPDRGARFAIRFPAATDLRDDQGAIEPRVVEDGTGFTLLVVDDLQQVRDPICKYLRNKGYTVLEADNTASAQAIIGNEKPDLVVTDILLKDGNGIEMIKAVENPPPTIFISGFTNPDIASMADLETGRNFLNKPFRLKDLALVVQAALKSRPA